MSKIWQYLTALFAGIATGIFIGVKWLAEKTIYKGKVKIKQKGEGHTAEMDTYITVKQARKLKRERRKAKKS